MGVRSMMVHRAVIERNSVTTTDDYGHPDQPVWAAHLTISCRVYNDAKRYVVDNDKVVTMQIPRIVYPLTVDVTKEDRITSITDRKGTVLFGDTYEINEVKRMADHFLAELRAVE